MNRAIFYVPFLHREAVHGRIPPGVSFFPAGLPESVPSFTKDEDGPSGAAASRSSAESVVSQALPLKPSEARSVLAEMLRLGEEFAPNGLLRQLAAHQYISDSKRESRAGEFADLDAFSATGVLPDDTRTHVANGGADPAEKPTGLVPAIRNALVDCQKVLLLAYSREEKLLELSTLEKRYLEAEKALAAALGESGDEEDAAFPAEKDSSHNAFEEGHAEPEVAVPWRVMVDAALPFLPEGAVLFTDNASMALELRDAGMLRPFPEDRAALCGEWPPEYVAGLLYVSLPAWRLVGRRSPMAVRPWLDREIEVLVSRPSAGWAHEPGPCA